MHEDSAERQHLSIDLFDYHLPPELIAQHPLEDRSASRLLILERGSGEFVHSRFRNIGEWLRPDDLLVINNTRVLHARLLAQRETGGRVELLLLEPLESETWLAMARPSRRLRAGEHLTILKSDDTVSDHSAEVVEKRGDGRIVLRVPPFGEIENEVGRVPLPHYITEQLHDPERYQTVFASEKGSVAAPTAGLHFTPEIIERLATKGIEFATVTLHVGPGTFQPIKSDNVLEHRMHAERFLVEKATVQQIREARDSGRRVIAVGTTSCRTLESIAPNLDCNDDLSGSTDLYITPGYQFQLVSGLLTNFHLPRSTLLLLVSALAGRDSILRAYEAAVRERYRFYSFGDAMLILPADATLSHE